MEQKKLTPAEAFNLIVPLARDTKLTARDHDVVKAALEVLRELVVNAEDEEKKRAAIAAELANNKQENNVSELKKKE